MSVPTSRHKWLDALNLTVSTHAPNQACPLWVERVVFPSPQPNIGVGGYGANEFDASDNFVDVVFGEDQLASILTPIVARPATKLKLFLERLLTTRKIFVP